MVPDHTAEAPRSVCYARDMRERGTVLSILVLTAVAGCGPRPRPADPDAPDEAPGDRGGGALQTRRVAPTPEAICARIFELKAARCHLTASYGLDEEGCRADFQRSFEERGEEARAANVALGHCLIDNASCEAADQCISALSAVEEGFRDCGTEGSQPVGLSAADYARRKGASVTRYSQASSTAEEPIEVCHIPAQMEWLLRATCDDGSQPFASYDHAHAARVGNVGQTGRCNSYVDLYEVPCPEGTYEIFIDAYVCPLP